MCLSVYSRFFCGPHWDWRCVLDEARILSGLLEHVMVCLRRDPGIRRQESTLNVHFRVCRYRVDTAPNMHAALNIRRQLGGSYVRATQLNCRFS